MVNVQTVAKRILNDHHNVPDGESMLVGMSGVDASGKGYLAAMLVDSLNSHGVNAIGGSVDGWLNLPSQRFSTNQPGEHFYHNAMRFEEMFDQFILPLKRNRSIHVQVNLVEEIASSYHSHTYAYQNIDVIVLEGIFLFKRAYLKYYDLKIWVDCSFDTALDRAIQRMQEGLSHEETIRAYETIYFPAQRIHFAVDMPHLVADERIVNDPRITPSVLMNA